MGVLEKLASINNLLVPIGQLIDEVDNYNAPDAQLVTDARFGFERIVKLVREIQNTTPQKGA